MLWKTEHTSITPISRGDFGTWKEYYRTYQYNLADQYYIPLMNEWGLTLDGKRVLDVGCGDGGFVAALADRGAACVGVDIKDFHWAPHPKVKYIRADVRSPDATEHLGQDFDLIVLRDVIEHIPLDVKKDFLLSLKRLARPDGRLFIAFPPYYSPFGLHQQTLLKSSLSKAPFLSLMSKRLLFSLLSIFKEEMAAREKISSIIDSRMTLSNFKKLLAELDVCLLHERSYLVRPSHEVRYGVRTKTLRQGGPFFLREMLTGGYVCLSAWRTSSKG